MVLLVFRFEQHSLSSNKKTAVGSSAMLVPEEQDLGFGFTFSCAVDVARVPYICIVALANYRTNPHLKTRT